MLKTDILSLQCTYQNFDTEVVVWQWYAANMAELLECHLMSPLSPLHLTKGEKKLSYHFLFSRGFYTPNTVSLVPDLKTFFACKEEGNK